MFGTLYRGCFSYRPWIKTIAENNYWTIFNFSIISCVTSSIVDPYPLLHIVVLIDYESVMIGNANFNRLFLQTAF